MIYDLLANIGNYRGMNRNLDKAIDYLMTVDINTLPLGKTEIDGDRVFLQVMEARTHELTDESYEVHRDYMDIQIDIDGCEVIETALNGVTPIGEYRPDFQKAAACAGAGDAALWGPAGLSCAWQGRLMGRADAWKSLKISKNVWLRWLWLMKGRESRRERIGTKWTKQNYLTVSKESSSSPARPCPGNRSMTRSAP